jgi:hypothetical protein
VGREPNDFHIPEPVDPTPPPVDVSLYVQSLKQTIESDPDSALLALKLLYTFLGPNGNFKSANDTPWEDYLRKTEDSTTSSSLKSLASAYRVQTKMDQHQFVDALSLTNNYLSDNLKDDLWFSYQAQKVVANLDLGNRSTAQSIYRSMSKRGNLIDSISTSMLGNLITNHPAESMIDSVVVVSLRVPQHTKQQAPRASTLRQNYPNPFNPVTEIKYELSENGQVSMKIYNVIGQVVRTLVNEYQGAGHKTLSFDASALPSGVYFYRLQAGTFTDIKKMLLIR